MIITESIVINAPLEKIWQTFTDLTCWTDWNSVMRDVDAKEKAITHGSSIQCSFRPFFFPVRVKIKIAKVVPHEAIVWYAKKKGLKARHELLFQPDHDAVTVVSREIFSGVLTKAYGLFFPKRKMKHLKKVFLTELKQASEAGNDVSIGKEK